MKPYPNEDVLDEILDEVRSEFVSATRKFGAFNSPHEAKAVIEEELDELWEEIKANRGQELAAIEEATQVAAMAVRYIYDMRYHINGGGSQ